LILCTHLVNDIVRKGTKNPKMLNPSFWITNTLKDMEIYYEPRFIDTMDTLCSWVFIFYFFVHFFFFNIVLWGLNWRLIWSKLLTKSEIKKHGTKMKHVGKMNDVLESFCKIFTCLLPNIRCVVFCPTYDASSDYFFL
jgi:hypothetical protein